MIARRLTLAMSAALCALACVFAAGADSAWASGSFQFGPMGEEAGQIGIYGSAGMAVDHASGDIYVSDFYNSRVEKFDQSGKFLLGWGWGVATGANEFQTCTTSCLRPEGASGAGALGSPEGIAVDQSTGDVYVVEFNNHRVSKFDSSGKFLLMFGGHVNKKGANVCVAAEAAECQAGTEGAGNGEFSEVYERAYIAVGPGGRVYVGDKARVQIFEPSGAWQENISLAALSSEGKVTALAVNSAGDMFVKDEGAPGVRELEPPLYLESPTKFDEGSEAVESIALDPSGNLFISENKAEYSEPCTCDFKEYSPSGQHLETFGGKTLMIMKAGMAFDEALKEVLVYGTDAELGNTEYGHYGVWAFTVPPLGPLIEAGSEKATPELRGAATLEATVNPEGNATTIHFEYVDETHFKASGYASTTSTAPISIGSEFSDEHVEVHLPRNALVPGVTYHWRVVAHNSAGTNGGPDQSFEEIPPAYVDGPWATHVSATGATLSAQIDPLGANTSYRFEYGNSTAYGHTITGNVGEGMGFVGIDHHIQELEAGGVYHYRIVTESEVGVVEGTDHAFVTQVASGALVLPDSRAWELVSPASKGGALIEDTQRARAASDGSAIVYAASEPIGDGVTGHIGHASEVAAGATVLSRRGATGWATHGISARQTLTPEGQSDVQALAFAAEVFTSFTPDLSRAVMEPYGLNALQSEEATEQTLYLRDNVSESYTPLVTAANVPEGTKWAAEGQEMRFDAATPDLKRILFSTQAALTPEAIATPGAGLGAPNLYEWSAGKLQLVNILPDGKTKPGATFGTGYRTPNPWAMSANGRWIVFWYQEGTSASWYVRDTVEHRTVQFGPTRAGSTNFETMSRDGSRIFYLVPESGKNEEGELYLFNPATGTTTSLTANHGGGPTADVQNMLVGSSDDGSYVYLVARGVLASGAVQGQNNLYLLHDSGGTWQTTLIATLSSEDEKDWHTLASQMEKITSRVTPSGRFLTFMSDRPLTGYDNHDARTGAADEEVYQFDAAHNRLVCVSCNPTGERPIGVYDGGTFDKLLMDQSAAWEGHWLAASIAPDWYAVLEHAVHRPPYLSENGRLFFNSSDALVPQDTNGVADVYEYEPTGVGSCTSASATFGEASNGCVSLISSGQSASESTFLDASESGNDAFFITAAKLVGADYDTVNDVYDAHVCTTALPCRAEPVTPPACTSGDSCKAAPSPQPAIFGTSPSATFSGTGNVVGEAKKSVVKHKRKPKRHAKHKKRKGKKARGFRTARTSRKGGRR